MGVFMRKKAIISGDKAVQGVDFSGEVRRVAGKLLIEAERALEAETPPDPQEQMAQQRRHERIFGHRVSLAAVLVQLLELVRAIEEPGQAGAENNPAMNEADAALLQAFIGRIRGADAA